MPDIKSIRIGNQTSHSAATVAAPFMYALANGFDAFEWFPDKRPPAAGWNGDYLDAEQRAAIRETARAKNIRLSVHARLEANPLEPGLRHLLLKDVELARELGAALLNIHLQIENGLAAYVKSITWLVHHLAGAGLQLAVENTPANSPEQFNELFAYLRDLDWTRNDSVGMCLDLGHANLCPATRNDYLGFLDRLQSHVPIIHLHLHENWGAADDHLPLFTGPAARDRAGVREFVRRMKQRGFSGSIILEQWPQPPSLLNQARDTLLQLWNESSAPASAAAESRPAPHKLFMVADAPDATSPRML